MMNNKMRKERIFQIEWQIRATERVIKVLHSQGADPDKILEYGKKREKIKDQL
jgi:hypothetical protein